MGLKCLLVVVIHGLLSRPKGPYYMAINTETTICPKCNNKFHIAENRTHKIKRRYAPFWFFDAMKQFENFNEVKCPSCGYKYKAKESKLFHFFESPYTVVALCLIFLILAITIVFILKTG